jgi:probable F420-dependent oxidoreductase
MQLGRADPGRAPAQPLTSGAVKIRIGFGLGTRTLTNDQRTFGPFIDALEDLGFDSVWLSERLGGECPDPVVGMAFAAGRSERLKFGTSVMVLPGRNPVVLAKELASIDRISGGRVLPAFGLGVADRHEQAAFGVEREERSAWFNEALPLIRRLWTEEHVTHHGERFHVEDVTLLPRPVQGDIDVWLGGAAPGELRRVGRMGDGWLPSFTTPEIAAGGWKLVNEAAAATGRSLDPEHFGVLVPYTHGPVPDQVAELVRRRRPEVDPSEVVPTGHKALRDHIQAFIEVGASKFVPVLVGEPDDWRAELEGMARVVLPLQT